ncbi:T9SS type A sorting domain-containing protein [uncultured Flavobacterium sp.]|uniref:T9SS type A sorting domain-containing protein n=1 Tax=uncultured Flavobacterium sp. TaxID=165435 RepID=UPI0030EB7AF9
MKNLFFYLVLFFTVITNAQTVAELDLTFNNNPNLTGDGIGAPYGNVYTSAKQSDGKILIGGDFWKYNGIDCTGIIRLNTDGSIDNSFNIIINGINGNNSIYSINILSDGKIIIAGNYGIKRLNSDGSIDSTFNLSMTSGGYIKTSTIQPDGKILIGGSFTAYNNISTYRIARLNTDGSLDTNFNVGGLGAQYGITGSSNETIVKNIKLQADGKIIVIGNFTAFNSTIRNHIARLNNDGSIDLSFNSEIGFGFQSNQYVNANSISIQPDNKIIVGGQFITYNNSPAKGLVRINSDGTIDNTFNIGNGFALLGTYPSGNTFLYPGYVIATEIQSDGKILIGGRFTKIDQISIKNLARLNSDGTLDSSFLNIYGPEDYNINYNNPLNNEVSKISSLLILSNQSILIGGNFNYYNYTEFGRIAKLNNNGTVDFDFNKNNGPTNSVFCTKIQSDGKIIIGGNFSRYNGNDQRGIVRVNIDGSTDTSFNIGRGIINSSTFLSWSNIAYVKSIIIQPDNKIIIGGLFNIFDNTPKNLIVRLNTDGSIDDTFNPFLPSIYQINDLILQPDGKVIVKSNNKLFRLNSDGSNDAIFNHITLYNSSGTINYFNKTIALKNDGKIIYSDGNSIKSLNTDGSIDSSFNVITTSSGVTSIEIQPDGKIIAAGDFTSVNNVNVYKIARFNSNGTLDVTFFPNNFYISNRILTTKTLSNGKILLGYDTNESLLLLNSNGSLDSNFNTGTGFGYGLFDYRKSIYDINIQVDNKILVGGSFTSYNGIKQNRILRLNNSGSLTNDLFNSSNEISLYPNPTNHLLNIDVPDNFEVKSINIINQIGQTIINQNENYKSIDVSTLSNGIYFIKINSENGTITKQFIKN